MTEPEQEHDGEHPENAQCASAGRSPTRWLQFKLGNLLLLVTIVGLVLALIATNLRLVHVQRELSHRDAELATLRPLPVEDVAAQFEKQTTLGTITTTVKDVRYSEEHDAYRVSFSWTDSTSVQTWFTDVTLESNGYGQYLGVIGNGPFVQSLGNTKGLTVLIESPSTFQK
ncbi:MAG: hypothetical protein KDA63_16440 [Planctomycetales bacterium]|nr:hypothetical protein [Planctomycetales bacterium]